LRVFFNIVIVIAIVMKPKLTLLTFLCLAALLGSSLASGDFGDFENDKVNRLSQEEIDKYLTTQTVTGRDEDSGTCSERVLQFRQKAAQAVSEHTKIPVLN